MGLNLDKIRDRLLNANSKGSGNVSVWKIPEGESVIRIVPTEDGDPFRDYWLHYNVGEHMGFLCPKKNYGQECPVCDFATKLWKGTDDADKDLAKKLFSKQRFYSPVLVRGEEDKKVRWWSYGSKVYKDLLKLITNEEYGDITDPRNGTDLVLDNSKPAGAAFPQTSVQPRRKESALCSDMDDDKCKELLSSIPDISKILKRMTPDEIRKILDEWILSGVETEDNPDTSSTGEIEKGGGKDSGKGKAKGKVKSKDEPAPDKDQVNPIDAAYEELLKD